MHYLTDRKRAEGLGSGRAGTHHFWSMTKSSAALAVLCPLFVLTFGPMLGQDFDTVLSYYSRPFPALVAGLTLLVGFLHFKDGVQQVILDYAHGRSGRFLIALMTGISYAAAAAGIFAVLRIAL